MPVKTGTLPRLSRSLLCRRPTFSRSERLIRLPSVSKFSFAAWSCRATITFCENAPGQTPHEVTTASMVAPDKAFNRLQRERLSERVAGELEAAIFANNFKVGETLPSEQRLANQFGVSRNVIREAFKILQERHLIEIINGSGALVCSPDSSATSSALGRYFRHLGADSAIDALYETRRILEGNNARLAAKRATESDLQDLAEHLNVMCQSSDSRERWSEADLNFHLTIARATQNPFLAALLEPLIDQLRSVIAEGFAVPGAVARGIEAHTKIYQMIRDHDEEGAYLAITEHLLDSESRVHHLD